MNPADNLPNPGRRSYRQCVALSKQSGERCKRSAAPDMDLCRFHNRREVPQRLATGRTLSKPGSAFMQSLPARYREAFARRLRSPDLVSLRSTLALVDSRIQELVEQLDNDGSGSVWERLNEVRREAIEAKSTGNDEALDSAVCEMIELIERGSTERESWSELLDSLERRRRIVDTETRREVAVGEAIGLTTLASIAAGILVALQEEGAPRQIRHRINEIFLAYVPREMPDEDDGEVIDVTTEGDSAPE